MVPNSLQQENLLCIRSSLFCKGNVGIWCRLDHLCVFCLGNVQAQAFWSLFNILLETLFVLVNEGRIFFLFFSVQEQPSISHARFIFILMRRQELRLGYTSIGINACLCEGYGHHHRRQCRSRSSRCESTTGRYRQRRCCDEYGNGRCEAVHDLSSISDKVETKLNEMKRLNEP